MLSIARQILLKDLVELAQSKILLALVFIAPLVLLFLMGNIRVREPTVRVAMYAGTNESRLQDEIDGLKALLDEQSNITVVQWAPSTQSLVARVKQERVDLVAKWDGIWHFYTAETHPYKLQFISAVVRDLVMSLERDQFAREQMKQLDQISLLVKEQLKREEAESKKTNSEPPGDTSKGKEQPPPPPRNQPQSLNTEILQTVNTMQQKIETSASLPVPVLSVALSNKLTLYFPPVSHADRSAVPGLIALVGAFIPFLLASGALVREREAGMLEVLLLASRGRQFSLVMGKLLLPLLISITSIFLLLVAARSAFSFGIKPGLVGMLALQALAMISSGLLGLGISALVRSQQYAYLISAVYLVCLILITGFIYPLEQSASVVRIVSFAFPLTFSGPAFEGWMTQGAGAGLYQMESLWLLCQCVIAAFVCAATLRRFVHTI